MKLLIIYNEDKVLSVMPYKGQIPTTPHAFLVETKQNALMMLIALGLEVNELENHKTN